MPFFPALLAATLVAAPQVLTLHPNAATSLSIAGAHGALRASGAENVVTVLPDAQPGTLDVRSSDTLGTGILHVTDADGDAVDVPVRVARDAGRFPSRVDVTVTGTPLQWTWLWTQIQAAIARAATVMPGATLSVTAPSPAPLAPAPQQSIGLELPVAIDGPQFYRAAGVVHVTVVDAPVEPVAPPLLLYDDDPERVDADGRIFHAQVTGAQAVRLYYYHDDGGDPRRLIVALHADADTLVQAIDASAGPNVDVLSVGHAVSRDALELGARNEGVVYRLTPGNVTVLDDVLMTAKQGVAGSIVLQVLHGGPAQIDVLSAAPDESIADALQAPVLPRDGHHRTGTFDIANLGTQALAYAAGGPDVTAEYGDRTGAPPNVRQTSDGTDFGDYGVVHTLLFSLSNPTSATATVYLFERPLGGIVRSSFLVDGQVQQVGCVRDPHERYEIAAFALAPGGRYQLQVSSMTDGGSNYPIEIGLTQTPPQPSAPPISSPDGCFPKPAAAPPRSRPGN